MPSAQKNVPAAKDVWQTLQDRTVARFISHLPPKTLPDDAQVRTAVNETEALLMDELCSAKQLSEFWERADIEERQIAYARLEFSTWKNEHPLLLPAPTFTERMNGAKLAIAVMLGTLAGAMLLSGAFNFLSDDPQTGQMLGGIIGSGAMVMVLWYASENKNVRRYLAAALGVATAAEVAIMFGKLSGLGMLWSALRPRFIGTGILVGLRRFFAYAGIVFLLRMSVRKPVFNRLEYEKNLRICIALWLDNARQFIASLKTASQKSGEKQALPEPVIAKKLGGYLHKLHQSQPAELATAASEMLLAARNIGFSGLDGDPAFISGKQATPQEFVWEEDMAEQFNTLGAIDAGDAVFVESLPVIQNGKVIEKGNVRKLRRLR